MEFLETIENIKQADASVQRLFGGEGVGVRAERGRAYQAKLAEAANFVADLMTGKIPAYHLREALGTSDFPLMFGDILDRSLLANYREWPVTYPNYCSVKQVPDFRTVNRYAIDGSESVLGLVDEQEEYPQSSLSETRYQFSVAKFGRKIPFSWESIINDNLQALQDIPQRFGRAARRSEEKLATQQFVDSTGPHASLYTSDLANVINVTNGAASNNPVLSVVALQDGFTVLAAMQDADSEPIVIDSVELVVPPALEVVALNILNALEIRALTSGGGTSAQGLVTANWLSGRLRLSVNPYLPIVANSSNGNTSWYLFANPSLGRAAVEVDFLRGHTEPEVFIKAPNAQRVGGGTAAPLDGDFDTDSIEYKVRHVIGAGRLDGKSTVASDGSGS